MKKKSSAENLDPLKNSRFPASKLNWYYSLFYRKNLTFEQPKLLLSMKRLPTESISPGTSTHETSIPTECLLTKCCKTSTPKTFCL